MYARKKLLSGVVILSILLTSCVEKKMTLHQAKEVSVSMRQTSFVPPPRSIDDILDVLNQSGSVNEKTRAAILKKATAEPPDSKDPGHLAEFYRDRGRSAKDLGWVEQELQDARTAFYYARQSNKMTPKGMSNLLKSLGSAEVRLGNFKKGQEHYQRGLEIFPSASHYHLLAISYFKAGNFKKGSDTIQKGIDFCNRNQGESKGKKAAKFKADKARMNAIYYGSLGNHKKAESYWRIYHRILETVKSEKPTMHIMSYKHLAKNLKSQGRLIEAELLIRRALKGAVALTGKDSGVTAALASFLGELLLKQGRLSDARKLIEASIDCYNKAGVLETSAALARVRTLLGEVKFAQKDFTGAAEQFEAVQKNLAPNPYFYNTNIVQNHTIILSFLISNRLKEADNSITFFFKNMAPYVDSMKYKSAEILALRGMLFSKKKKKKQALEDFSNAMPRLFKEKGDEDDFLKTFRLKLITESYMDLLFGIKKSSRETTFNVNASAVIFNLCEQLNHSSVNAALGASGARAAAMDPDLSDLVRREQDASKQINTIKQTLINIVSTSSDQLNKSELSNLKTNLNSLVKARQALLAEIESRFPKYSDFIHPKPKKFQLIRKKLNPEEAMVIMYPVTNRMYLWGFSKTGPVRFHSVNMPEKKLTSIVKTLRKSLAPNPGTFDDIPEFNIKSAHALYKKLFGKIEDTWQSKKDLLVVAPGVLGQLPLGVLPVSLVELGTEKNLLYDNYRKVPWFIKKVSITRLPSVSSLLTLRALPKGAANRLPFIGFGDPIFNMSQLADGNQNNTSQKITSRGILKVRGIRKIEKKQAAITTENTMSLSSLSRLPDTADEIAGIAAALGVDSTHSVFLRQLATETNVKRSNLSNVKVIAFASHGLIPGDLDGLTQPAIALTAPDVASDFDEDGLLTMGEILKLKLNADWVVLSACNTGAADGAGAEAVSGLGRSFFYAGTRALLVTMWAVESTSAKKLTTGLFRFQNENPDLSRAKALQKSIIELIDKKTLTYKGQDIAAYAHPFFWAPFIVVGDGG